MAEFDESRGREYPCLVDEESSILAGGMHINLDKWDEVNETISLSQITNQIGWANVQSDQVVALIDPETSELLLEHPCAVLGLSFETDEEIMEFLAFLVEGGPEGELIVVRISSSKGNTGAWYVSEEEKYIKEGHVACHLVNDIDVAKWVEGSEEIVSRYI